jgi:hypothetical protein
MINYMRTVATRVDNSLHEKVVSRYNSLDYNPSEYIRNLINGDLEDNNEGHGSKNKIHSATQTISNHASKDYVERA